MRTLPNHNVPGLIRRTSRWARIFAPAATGLLLTVCGDARGQLSKANLLLLDRGLQLQGMVTAGDVFHLATYSNAAFTAVNWLWTSNPSLLGPAPGFPWSRWVFDETNMPGPPLHAVETPYLSQLVSLQLGDEMNLNDDAVRTRAVNWFNAVRTNWPNTILYANNWGGQIPDGPLGDFIARARPDMLCFDTYPFQSDYVTRAPLGGPPTSWYSELRRYRAWAWAYHIPYACYRQTFHAVQDYNATVYRDPSPAELRLNTFAALAFNAKALINFTYNTGASSLFTSPGGDTYPTPLYDEQADINRRGLNLGKALLRLKPLYELHNQNNSNPPPGPASSDPCQCFLDGNFTSILFLRGHTVAGGVTNYTPLPNSFSADPQSPALPANPTAIPYSWWEFQKNDPYLTGWAVTNKAGLKNHGLPGDVILAWFTPLDESFDGPNFTNEVYFMVLNALTDTNGPAADCRQEIKLNFLNQFTGVVMLDAATGQLQTNTLPVVNTRRQLVLTLDGGAAALFKIADGAPFVGFHVQAPQLSIRMQGLTPAITLQGTLGAHYSLQTAISLPLTNWTTLTNVTLPGSPWTFLDPTYSGANRRFYRATGLP